MFSTTKLKSSVCAFYLISQSLFLSIREVGPETKELKVRLVEKNSKGERESLFSAYHSIIVHPAL